MRLIIALPLITLLSGCSLFGTYTWLHPQKTDAADKADRAECLAMASIVFGSNADLLALAKSGTSKPNRGLEADCLAAKGYRRTFVPK